MLCYANDVQGRGIVKGQIAIEAMLMPYADADELD